MRKIITGVNEQGQEIELGEIMMKYQTNSDLDRPVLKMLQLKNGDSFFFKFDDKSKKWLLQKDLCFINLESPIIEVYQQMNVTGDICLNDFQEMLYLKFF